jgi:hypothetical protein
MEDLMIKYERDANSTYYNLEVALYLFLAVPNSDPNQRKSQS